MMEPGCYKSADNSFGPSISCSHAFDFTLVFEQSILSIGPSALFLLLAPWRVWQLYGKSVKTVRITNCVLWLKLILAISLVGIRIATLALWIRDDSNTIRTAVPAVALSLLGALFVAILSFFEHGRSVRPSTLLTVYLLLSILFDSVHARTLFLRPYIPTSLAATVTASIGLQVILLLLETQHKGNHLSAAHREKYSPEELSGILTRTVFSWLNTLFVQGFRKMLTLDDLFPTDNQLSSDLLMTRLKANWAKNKSSKARSIIYATLSCLRWEVLKIIFPRLCLVGLSYAQTFFIEGVITNLNRPGTQSAKNDGYGLIGAAALIYGGIAISTVHYQHELFRMITMFRGAFVALIYDHSMTLQDGQYDESKVITHMSTDVDMIARSLEQMNELWARVLEVAVGIWLLERQLGAACVAPVLVILVCTSLQTYMATFMPARQKLWMGAIEQRLSIISSTLKSMRSIKMLGLSGRLGGMLQSRRKSELDLSRKFRWLIVWLNVVASLPQMCGALATFAAFVIRSQIDGSNPLSVAQAFTSLAIISLITAPSLQLLASIPALTASKAAFDRAHRFLICPSLDVGENQESTVGIVPDDKNFSKASSAGIKMEPLNFQMHAATSSAYRSEDSILTVSEAYIRPAQNSKFLLQNVNLKIRPGSFTFINGPIGCGKSVLLRAVMGEIVCEKGQIAVNSKGIAYCCQTPWLQNTTIRNNILGYSGFNDMKWYHEVIHACELEDDLANLSHGEESIVESQGLTLSGGQKQRLALARALYSRAKLLVLDDVLSAVDWQTAKAIFERVFGKEGLCRRLGISVLMTTHSKEYLSLADEVVILNSQGCVVQQGPFQSARLTNEVTDSDQSDQSDLRQNSKESILLLKKELTVPKLLTPETITDMSRQTGDIAVYSYYLGAIGWPLVLGACMIIVVYTLSANFPQVWLDIFTKDNDSNPGRFIGIYVLLAVVASASQGFMIWQIMINIVVKSGLALHGTLVKTVMNAPMKLFAEVDSGVILNRFSQDMTLVDAILPTVTFGTVLCAAQCLAQAALISLGSSYMAITIIPTLVVLYVAQKVYLRTSRQLRFLDLEAKSPLYTHFVETLSGLTTIRGFGWQSHFIDDCLRKLDMSQRPYYLLFCIQRWLNVVLDLLVAVLVVILTALAVSLRDTVDPGRLGVSLTAIVAFNQSLQELVTSWTQMETSLGAVARTRSFELSTACEHQPGEDFVPPIDWPSRGKIEVESVAASHDGTTNVLENVNITIEAGERVAICGRTGSGKSTFFSLLLRLLDPKAGTIRIDNIDIATMPRNELRSRLVVIPQDPLPALPCYSIRFHLDPHGVATDAMIMAAVRKVGLLTLVGSRGGLDAEDLSSQPLSQGEQKLFALARALVSKWSRESIIGGARGGILILDEFTGSTDAETEQLMMDTVEEEFVGYTILLITHQISVLTGRFDRTLSLISGRLEGKYAAVDD